MQKSNSTHTLYRSKASSMVGSSSLKATQTKFKVHLPFFSPLHSVDSNLENKFLSEAKNWHERRAINPPKRRSFHTSCIYDNYLYIFGGKDITEGKLSDIMRINLKEEKDPSWETVSPANEKKLEPLAYHTGTLIGDEYYIIGGSNAFLRQSPFIYIYNLRNNTLKKIKLEKSEDIISYLTMHTANFYEKNNEIILFGGYSDGSMLNKIYRYNIRTQEVKLQKEQEGNSTPDPRIGHSSFIHQNYLYIFGGSIQDGNLLNDLWKFDLDNFVWQKLLNNNIDNEGELIAPSPRSGHAIYKSDDNTVYIFGGKIGNFQEANDLWKYDISSNGFKIIHDTILEQYSSEELEEFLKEKNAKKKNKESDFHFISKKEQDDKLNPFSKYYVENKSTNRKMMFKSKSTKDINKNDYENEIFVNPGYYQMKHSSVYNLDNKDINSAIASLDMLLPYKLGEKGIKMPLPRDGSSLLFLENNLFVFGGDRNKYPFNDLFIYNIK